MASDDDMGKWKRTRTMVRASMEGMEHEKVTQTQTTAPAGASSEGCGGGGVSASKVGQGKEKA
eukprot:2678816-Pyramimonas_sp.AAC.1